MTKQDIGYILWLCKRLVNRYKEDPKIYENVASILEKNQKQLSFYEQTHSNIDKYIAESISNLDNIRSSYRSSIIETNKKYIETTNNKTNEMFENLDFNQVLSSS